jgi:hypothetical protein
MSKTNPFLRHPVEGGSFDYGVTVRSSMCIGLIIRYAKEDVGTLICG